MKFAKNRDIIDVKNVIAIRKLMADSIEFD